MKKLLVITHNLSNMGSNPLKVVGIVSCNEDLDRDTVVKAFIQETGLNAFSASNGERRTWSNAFRLSEPANGRDMWDMSQYATVKQIFMEWLQRNYDVEVYEFKEWNLQHYVMDSRYENDDKW